MNLIVVIGCVLLAALLVYRIVSSVRARKTLRDRAMRVIDGGRAKRPRSPSGGGAGVLQQLNVYEESPSLWRAKTEDGKTAEGSGDAARKLLN